MDFNSWVVAHGYEHPVDPRWVQSMAQILGDSRLIGVDVGGGPGKYAKSLNEIGYRFSVYDAAEAMVAEAWLNGVTAYHAHAENLPLRDRSVSAVLMRTVVHHFEDLPKACAESQRILESGGLAIIQTRSRQNLKESPLHRLLRNEEILERDWQRWVEPQYLLELLGRTGFGDLRSFQLTEHEGTETKEGLVQRLRLRGGDSLLHLLSDVEIEKIVSAVEARKASFFPRQSRWTILVAQK